MRRCLVFAFIFGLLIVTASGLQIDCEFDIVNYELGDFYTCKARKLIVTTENEVVERVVGDHFHGKTNIDVRVFVVDDQKFTFFPLDVDNFFPNLKGLKVISSGLTVLTQDNLKWFSDLQFCIFDDNEIEILPGELFIYNSKLKRISFDNNKISFFGKNVLDVLDDLESVSFLKNKCIDESWTQRETIEEAKKKLAEKCESESKSALGMLNHLNAHSADTTKSLKDSVSEYLVRDVTVTKMVKITRHGSARQYNFGEKFESSDGSLEIACDIVETFWKYSNAELVTCNVQNEPIEFLGYRLTFPDGGGEDVRALSFNDNKKVNFLPENIAEAFPNLLELSAKNSFIETIPAKTFVGLDKLKKLDLSHNDLKIIENGAFAGLAGLEVLDLSEGSIGYVEEGSFADLTSLKTLHLGGNKLHYLLVNIFQGLTELRNVSLELNHLTDIDEALFSTNTKLVNIWLNKNQLNIISPKAFEGLTELAYIDLQGNECIDGVYDASTFDEMNLQMEKNCASSYVVHRTFEKVKVSGGSTVVDENDMDDETLMKVTQEAEIVLTNNLEKKTVSCLVEGSTCVISDQGIDDKDFKIKEIDNSDDILAFHMVNNKMTLFLPQNLSQILPNLVEISTENSSLVYLTRKNFHGLANLKTLNLANNNIKFIEPDAFDDLNELEELDLSGNGIEYIDENLFLKLRALKRLRLDDNKLHFIHPKLFRNLRNLQNISISSNSLSTLDGNLFKTNQKLKSVGLQGNNIKSASPNMFSSAKGLESVDLRDNKCITAAYEKSAFETMKADILDKCGAGYVLLHGKKAKKNEPKKKKEKIKTTTEATDELKEVGCDYEDIFWPSLNKNLFTCVISGFDSITGPDYTMTANMPFALPFIEGESVQAVKFSNNKDVKFLPKNIGKVFPNLELLTATGTSVSSITKNVFKDLPKLRHLNLSGNQIKSIDPRAFKYLTSLEELILDDNEFEYIEVTTFTYLKNLRKLKMLGNKIKTFEPGMFEGMTELIDVSVELQDSSQVPEDFFKSYPDLKYFTFNGKTFGPGFELIEDSEESTDNNPTESFSIEATTLVGEDENGELKEVECVLGELFSMAINENLFTCEINEDEVLTTYKIKFSPELRKVRRIIIANRKNIKSLPENLLEVFPNLIEISAENSGITELNGKTLHGLKALKVIDLVGNSIKHIESDTFDDTENLEVLDLSDNDMEFLEETLLYKLKYLKRLSIDGNRIHFIHSKTFKHLESIEEVTLSRNVLSIIELYTFRYNPKLRVVDISNNSIESLSPKTFSNLKALTSIKLDGNKCIEGTFGAATLDDLTNEITKSCNTKPSDEQTTVTCAFDEADDSCTVSDQPIESSEYSVVMKPSDVDSPREVKKLKFVGPDVKFLPKNIGKEFPQLEEISVENSRLSKISSENFVDLEKLKSLKLGGVESIEPDTFTGLSSLENLEMEPEVEELDENLFAKLTSLKTIFLVSKSIRRMNPKAFNNLHEVIAIKLNFYQLGEPKEVQESLQRNNKKLKFIQINDKTITIQPLEADDVEFTNQFAVIPKSSQQPETTKVSCDFETIVDENGTSRFVCSLKHQTIDNNWTVVEESINNQHVDWIDFSYNLNVKFLPANFAQSFPKATKIVLRGTSIEKLSPESFKSFEHLQILGLSNNKIDSVGSETFSDLKSLTDLDLARNGISELDENTFGSMPSLQTLNLNDNKLTTLNPMLFDKLPALKNLNLDGNPNLPQINESELFKNNHELTNVKLSISNTLKPETTTKAIEVNRQGRPHESRKPTASSRRSTTIKPSRNVVVCQLAQMNWVDDGSLVTCDLSNQNIPDADTVVQSNPYTMHIQALKIENNKNALYLPENLAESFPSLQKLSAKNSSLSAVFQDDFVHMKNLIAADFSGNNIETIEPETFSDLTSLEDLNLNGNQIEYVDEKAFFKLEKLRTLNLKDNKISLIHPKTFNRLPALTTVNLEENNIQEKLKAELIRSNPTITFTFSFEPSVTEEPHTTLATTTRRYSTKPKEVSCVYSDTFWNFSSSELFTCNLKRAVEDMNIRIKASPRNTRVRGLNVIDNKNMKFLPINLSEHFPKLIGISAYNSSLETISPRNFENLFDLKHLTLAKNNLKTIDPASFKDLQSLEELDLSDNEIEQLDESTFDNLGSLKSLSLGGNKLRNLPANIFKSLHNLRNISLSNNLFSTMNPVIFKNNLKLENVWLNGNRIKHVEPQTFDRLLNLEFVDFRQNDCIDQYFEGSTPNHATHSTLHMMIFELSSKCKPGNFQPSPGSFRTDTKPSIPKPLSSKRPKTQKISTQPREIPCKFKYIKSLQNNSSLYTCIIVETSNPSDIIEESKNALYVRAIEFRGKKIKSLPKNIARVFPNIIKFLVRSTSLSKIDPQTFEGFSKLKTLSLPDNKIEVVNFSELTTLDSINLNHNRIKRVDGKSFPLYIKKIDLGNNLLDSIEPQAFGNLKDLKSLSLERNQIAEVDGNAFKSKKMLEEILLGGNKITRMNPKAFQQLPMLTSVNLEGNPCISGLYTPASLKALSVDISRNCDLSYLTEVDNEEHSYVDENRQSHTDHVYPEFPVGNLQGIEDDDSPKRVDPDAEVIYPDPKKVYCEFGETFSSFAKSPLYTCTINDQKIDSEDFTFNPNPNNKRVKRMVFDSKRGPSYLPNGIGETFPNIVEMVARNGSLKLITPEAFEFMPNLRSLDLSANRIHFIAPYSFDGLSSLEELSLSQNNIKTLDVPNVRSLIVLNLDDNELTSVETTFSRLPHLTALNLGRNQLTSVDSRTFSNNAQLEIISMNNNQLTTINPKTFANLSRLKALDLRQNECIDQAFGLDTIASVEGKLENNCHIRESFENLLSTCQRENEDLRRASQIVKSNPKESEDLKEKLYNYEMTISQLHRQIKDNQEIVHAERQLARKLKEITENLKNQLEDLQSNCVHSTVKYLMVDIDCSFNEIGVLNDYSCDVQQSLNVPQENETIRNVRGNHKRGKRNSDVTSLIVSDQSVKFIPSNIAKHFPKLNEMILVNSKLNKIDKLAFKDLHRLMKIVIRGNNVNSIEPGSFDENLELEYIDLSSNNLQALPSKLFGFLPNLKVIHVNHNAIERLNADVMPIDNVVEDFSISDNKLKLIDPRFLKSLTQAQVVDFSNNNCVDHKHSSDGDQSIFVLFGEIAVKCSDDSEMFCRST